MFRKFGLGEPTGVELAESAGTVAGPEFSEKRGEFLYRILERGQKRGEVMKNIDLENYVTMILAMQDGILALKVLDDGIDDEEKYKNIQTQMWKDISTEGIGKYRDGGVTSAVS